MPWIQDTGRGLEDPSGSEQGAVYSGTALCGYWSFTVVSSILMSSAYFKAIILIRYTPCNVMEILLCLQSEIHVTTRFP